MVDLVVLNPMSDNGWRGDTSVSVRVTQTDSGAEQRLQKWAFGKRKWEIPFDHLDFSDYQALRNFYELRGGTARGFLIWDASEFYAADQPIGTGNGTATQFQIQVTKADASGSVITGGAGNSFTKNIAHPMPAGTAIPIQYQGVPGGFNSTFNTVQVGGVAKTQGTDYTISSSTGLITFAAAPAEGAAIVWTGWYYFPVRFDGELPLELNSIWATSHPKLVELFYE